MLCVAVDGVILVRLNGADWRSRGRGGQIVLIPVLDGLRKLQYLS